MDIKEFIKSRRTVRKFEQKPLNIEQLISYVDAARLAPSAANLQPLKYIAIQNIEMAQKMFPLVKWAGYLASLYNPKENERPVAYIIVCVDKEISKHGCELDIGAAAENIILAAMSDGVGSCWLGSIDRPKIKKLLDIPEQFEISCVIALGYPKESPKEIAMTDDIKYYLDGETLCVPKRSIDETILKIL